MMAYVGTAGFALFLWWFSTGAIFYLDGLPERTHRWSMLGATLVLAACFRILWTTSGGESVSEVFTAFSAGLLAWGWQEISLYTGYVTGPRKVRCPAGCSGARHFGHAIAANLWHEIAIIVVAVAIALAVWDGPNRIGLWTYLLLWGMHLSARLNVFLGVPNVSEEFLPPRMEVLKSFLTRRPMNVLFPFSVTGATVGVVLLIGGASGAESDSARTGLTLLAALMGLALLEHWCLVLPLPFDRLWAWAKPRMDAASDPSEDGLDHLDFAPVRVQLSRRFDARNC